TGPTGPTGPAGMSACPSSGELVVNGGMEEFTGTVPTGWTSSTPTLISQATAQGRVHTGLSAVSLENGATLTQTITPINPECFYEFSFFAKGEGSQVGFVATVYFLTPGGDVLGAMITAREQDVPDSNRNFSYYRALTSAAPNDATGVRIDFTVTAQGGQSLDLDNVSFGSQ
ncbi:MAG TPA: hypothetical protein DD738_13180, partial [Ruminiclostridium sp.]|nr:hypothetical protein [Ruminiclostridium sp.]